MLKSNRINYEKNEIEGYAAREANTFVGDIVFWTDICPNNGIGDDYGKCLFSGIRAVVDDIGGALCVALLQARKRSPSEI